MKLNTKEFEEKMKKTVSIYEREIATIRAGRANPAVLDKISVDYYGAPTPINQLATVSVTDAYTLVIHGQFALENNRPRHQASDLGIMPQNDGKSFALHSPLTEERRRELAKQVGRMGEDAKISIVHTP